MQETNVTHGESETGVHLEGEWELTGWKRRKGGRQPEAGEHTCAWGMPIGPVWQELRRRDRGMGLGQSRAGRPMSWGNGKSPGAFSW